MPVIFLLLGFLATRLVPYFWSSVPLGYDSGLYLFLFKEYQKIPYTAFAHLPKWVIETYDPGVVIVGKALSQFVALERLLIPLIIASSVLLFLSLYLLTKKLFGKTAAFWSVLIFACSAIQFRFYWYYYLRNITAVSFLLVVFYFLSSGSYWSIIFSILVVYFHRQTAALLFAVLVLGLIFFKKRRRYYLIVLLSSLLAAALYYLPTWNLTVLPLLGPILQPLLPNTAGDVRNALGGTFYGLLPSFLLMLPYLPLAIYGLKKTKKDETSLPVIWAFIITLVIVALRLFFYRRFIPFIDLFLIIFAGVGVSRLSARFNPSQKSLGFSPRDERALFFAQEGASAFRPRSSTQRLLALYSGFLFLFIGSFIYFTGHPLILDDELEEIKQLSRVEPNAFVLVTDQVYTPWVYGWSERKPITPGFGENDIYWSESQWRQFWQNDNSGLVHDLFLKLPKPLYIYHGDRHWAMNFYPEGKCFQRINWRTWKFVCEK